MRGDRWRKSRRIAQNRRYGGKRRSWAQPSYVRLGLLPEPLEARLLLTVPAVLSIDRDMPLAADTSASTVAYRVSFSEPVTNVSSADFAVMTTGSVSAALPVDVTGSGAIYTVTIGGIQGSGALRLDLIDDDSIQNGSSTPLGDVGAGNGDFQGQSYTIDQLAPRVLSINGTNPSNLTTGATTVVYTVTFSEPVSVVDPADFTVTVTGSVIANSLVAVAGSDALYSVTVSGISGSGSLRLHLTDNGSIHDAAGNRLVMSNGPASFASQQTFATGFVPIFVTAADFNKDAKQDLAVANFFNNNVSLLLGNGDGTFQSQTTVSTLVNPNWLATSDVNGDGNLDLISANLGSDNLSVLLGNGDGTFQSQSMLTAGDDPQSVTVADVNGDGRPDLVVSNASANNVGVLLGNNDGTFQSQVTVAAGLIPQSVVAADVNGDQQLDLLVANFGNSTVGVLLGNGNGTFQSQTTFPTGWKPQMLALADVNGDVKLDLVVVNSGDDNVGVLLGNGDGTFQSQVTFAAGTNPQSVAVADVNGDGKRDLVITNFDDSTVGVLLGNGNGTFQSQTTFAVDANPQSVAVVDLNQDNRPDLVTANLFGDDVSVLLGNRVGSFAGQIYTIETATHLEFMDLPGTSVAGTVINAPTGVRVAVKDQFDNVVVDDTSTVTLSLVGGTFAGGGTTALAPVSNGIATFSSLVINTAGYYALEASDGTLIGAATPQFAVVAVVVDRKLFYDGSPRYDVTNGMFPGFSDDNAIAADKVALLPGGPMATFANLSSHSRGITGVMIDLFGTGQPSAITASDFAFRVGNNNAPNTWSPAPAPATVTVRSGAGVSGADRIELIWTEGVIQKTWLEVIVAANARTGLATFDRFFFGHALGDTGMGDTPINATVNSIDEAGARSNPEALANNIPATNLYDFNRDGRVNSIDEGIARENATNSSNVTHFIEVGAAPPAAVVGRKLFYDGSSRYDVTNGTFPGFSDDNAVATDKVPLLPGGPIATFANVSSYSRGITGIMIDLLGSSLAGSITASDFVFKIGNNNTPSSWATATSPSTVTVRAGAGVSGSDRVELIWPAGAIQKTWIEVIVAANGNTGLAFPDIFFFGHALGDTGAGDTSTHATVNSVDEAGARNNPQVLSDNIPLTNVYDFNRDGRVNSIDEAIARNNATNSATVTQFIMISNPPAAPEGPPLEAAAPQTAGPAAAMSTSEIVPAAVQDSSPVNIVACSLASKPPADGSPIRLPPALVDRVCELAFVDGGIADFDAKAARHDSKKSEATFTKFHVSTGARDPDDTLLDELFAAIGLE